MSRKQNKKIMSGLAGATLLLSGCAAAAPVQAPPVAPGTEQEAPKTAAGLELNGYQLEALAAEETEYTKVANVEGEFSYNQDVISPSNDVFNLYGTALTGACAKPAFALAKEQESVGEYYINVSGSLKYSQSITLADLEEKEETRIMACACATGSAVANAEVSGIPLSAILELSELEAGANTVTVTGSDGYGIPMPLSYALEKNAMLVYKVNGETLPDGQTSQLWMPGTVAKYFTRNVVNIEVTAEDEVPEVITAGADYRAHVSIMNDAGEAEFTVGEKIVFEGYADDYDVPVTAIEVSMDDGETWTVCEVKDATAEKWVYWYFGYTPKEAGTYKLTVRARTAEDVVSPLASTIVFTVGEGDGV
ncbi:MAG: molybdopterin-dependent oxidoreductase [Lachnospiraceae bacterium]|nr:molybdopterin-dependent oxidoreductase [Lachnospiraceae bacterium]